MPTPSRIVQHEPLFTDDDAKDASYCNVRAARNDWTRKARANCEALWKIYEQHADPEFRIEIRDNFDARYWEMYLTTYLIKEGFKVKCPKPGPDVGIVFARRRIWFEATSPSRGADDAPDQVPALKVVTLGEEPIVQDVPNEKMVLRYLNSIAEKRKQHASWLTQGIVSTEDAFVIAINPRRLGHEVADTVPPRILQAAFPLGNPYAVIDANTAKPVETGYQFRDVIEKRSGAAVSTGVFLQNEYATVSGLLCSRADVVNQPEEPGSDFQLVPNPKASVILPTEFRLKGTYFFTEHTNDRFTVTPQPEPNS
jgi:hypothetical protein